MIQSLVKHFLRGLLFVIPVTLSAYILYIGFWTLERLIDPTPLLGRRIPGAGVVFSVALVIVVGFLASNFATRWLFRLFERVFARLPLFRLLYVSLRDLTEAFVGDRKRFDAPVLVQAQEAPGLELIGFMTREDLGGIGLTDRVAVYIPQSYNFAGNLIIVPRERVRVLEIDATTAMTFIVSAGVSGERVTTPGRR